MLQPRTRLKKKTKATILEKRRITGSGQRSLYIFRANVASVGTTVKSTSNFVYISFQAVNGLMFFYIVGCGLKSVFSYICRTI